jgi:hypothetical protein
MELTRIRLSDITDDRFCILGDKRRYHNRDYRTLVLHEFEPRKRPKEYLNCIEVRNRKVIDRLAFRYGAEAISRPASSVVEPYLDKLSFGWADVKENARFLVLDSEKTHFSPAKVARWLKRNCTQDALILEGNTRCRVSFASEEDFLLARLQFS